MNESLLEKLRTLRALEAAATPPPWTRVPGSALVRGPTNYNTSLVAECEDNEDLPLSEWSNPEMMAQAKANADLIVAMRGALPKLLDAAEMHENHDGTCEATGNLRAMIEAYRTLKTRASRLREAADAARELIRSAAPLSWASGTSLEAHAYAWEKESDGVLNALDAALDEKPSA